jgi:hypothetical protein
VFVEECGLLVGFQGLVVTVQCADTTFYLPEKPQPGCDQQIPAFVQINFFQYSCLLRPRLKVILLSAMCQPGVSCAAHGEAGEIRIADDGGIVFVWSGWARYSVLLCEDVRAGACVLVGGEGTASR